MPPSRLSLSRSSSSVACRWLPVLSEGWTASLGCSASYRRPQATFATAAWVCTYFWMTSSGLQTCNNNNLVLHFYICYSHYNLIFYNLLKNLPWYRRLWKVVSIEFAHCQANVALREAEFDSPLLEGLGELLELLQVGGLLGRGFQSCWGSLDGRRCSRRRWRSLLLRDVPAHQATTPLQRLLLLQRLQLLGCLRHCLLNLK